MLDYGAGNVRSLVNAINHLGYDITFVKDPSDIAIAEVNTNQYVFVLYKLTMLCRNLSSLVLVTLDLPCAPCVPRDMPSL